MPPENSNLSTKVATRRWTILSAGLLLVALALVVIYTSKGAFLSPLALVVVAAIGLAALLLRLRLTDDQQIAGRTPLWLNILAIVLAVAAVLADIFRIGTVYLLSAALSAVVCFAISGAMVLSAMRKRRT